MRESVKRFLTTEVLTLAEAARLLRLDTSTLRHRIRVGSLASLKRGTTHFVDRVDVEVPR